MDAVFSSLLGSTVDTCFCQSTRSCRKRVVDMPIVCWTVWSRQFRDLWRLHRSSSWPVCGCACRCATTGVWSDSADSRVGAVCSGLVLLVSTHFALCFLLCSQALMPYIMAGMDQKDIFCGSAVAVCQGRRHACRYAEAVSHGPACLADHRDFAVAVRAGYSMSLVCMSMFFLLRSCSSSRVVYTPVVAQSLSHGPDSSSDLGFSSCFTG